MTAWIDLIYLKQLTVYFVHERSHHQYETAYIFCSFLPKKKSSALERFPVQKIYYWGSTYLKWRPILAKTINTKIQIFFWGGGGWCINYSFQDYEL